MSLRAALAFVLLVVAGGLALADEPRPRVIVSTDAGGTDYDDLQSLVHLFLHADVIDIEGLVSSPYGPGRARHIRDVIDVYARDVAALRRHAAAYPDPEALRRVTVQGAIESAGAAGFGAATAGSRWIVECGRRHARPRRPALPRHPRCPRGLALLAVPEGVEGLAVRDRQRRSGGRRHDGRVSVGAAAARPPR